MSVSRRLISSPVSSCLIAVLTILCAGNDAASERPAANPPATTREGPFQKKEVRAPVPECAGRRILNGNGDWVDVPGTGLFEQECQVIEIVDKQGSLLQRQERCKQPKFLRCL
jgi:hypothetical protein